MAALFSLTSLMPAQAQQPTPHSWNITYNTTGTTTYAIPDSPTPGQSTLQSFPFGGIESETYINGNLSGMVTVTLTWVPATGQTLQSDPPPEPVYIKEFGNAEESPSQWHGPGSAPTLTGSADDGLGDPPVAWYNGLISTGTHLVQRDGSSEKIVLGPFSVSAVNPTSSWVAGPYNSHYWDWMGGLCEASVSVSIDNRSVTINSSIDPTYHKDPVLGRTANVPASDGTITADSVNTPAAPGSGLPGPAITYYGHPIGNWSSNSAYHWYSAVNGNFSSGTFTMPDDPPIPLTVFYGVVSQQEHINLDCIDAYDEANATANYYVNWHDPFENWNTIVDIKQYGDFVRVTPIYHPVAEDAKFSYDVETSVKVSAKATGEGSLEAKQIATKFGVELGAEYESATKVTVEYPLVANKANWIERQAFWEHREGTVDNYDIHGYAATLNWTLDSAYHPGNPLLDYGEFQRASVTDPPN